MALKQAAVGVIDLSLASSYAPGIICVGKATALITFNYILGNLLWMGLMDRCVVMSIVLYLDRAHHREYIIDTNACIGFAFFGVAVNELRASSSMLMPQSETWPYAYGSALAWGLYSLLVLTRGESAIEGCVHSMQRHMGSYAHSQLLVVHQWFKRAVLKSSELPLTASESHAASGTSVYHASPRPATDTRFIPLLGTACCLYMNCNVSLTYDVDYNLDASVRVFCFVSVSLLWLYTANVKQMQGKRIASFAPCVNRFMVLLLSTPLFLAIATYLLMVSIVLYRGWELLTTAVNNSAGGCVDSLMPPPLDSAPLQYAPMTETLPERVPERAPERVPEKTHKKTPVGLAADAPFDPEAAYAELKQKGVSAVGTTMRVDEPSFH